MTRLSEWNMAQRIQASGRRGIIIGICIALLVIAAVVITVIKINWLKKTFGNCCDCGDFDDDFYIDEDDIDEDGCCYTSEKNFV
jgi:hypothetical protein